MSQQSFAPAKEIVRAARRAGVRPVETCRICGEQPQVIARYCGPCYEWFERQSPMGHRVIRCLTIYFPQPGITLRRFQAEPWRLHTVHMVGPKSIKWLLEAQLPERATISWPMGGWAAV